MMATIPTVSLTIFQESNSEVVEDIKPENIELDEQSGKTYINLQPVTNDPGWMTYQPEPQLPTTFIPQHDITPLEHPHWANMMQECSAGYPDLTQVLDIETRGRMDDLLQVPQNATALQNRWLHTP